MKVTAMKRNLFSLLLLLLISFACNSLAIAQCPGDTNRDGDTDGSDLYRMILDYGRTDCSTNNPCPADFDGDHSVDEVDLDIFLEDFGSVSPALSTARVHVIVTDIPGGLLIDGALVSVISKPDSVCCYPYPCVGTAPLAFTFSGVPSTPIEISFEASAPNYGAVTKTVSIVAFATIAVEIAFKQVFSLSIQVAGDGQGFVTSSPLGIDCGIYQNGSEGKNCTAGFAEGSNVALIASPTYSSKFVGWTGAGCSGSGMCIVHITQPVNVVATFSK
jgi:hypothetical protein